jgi:antitoxin ParD1/3/4
MNQPSDLLKNQEVRELDALLLDGLDSGEPIPVTAEYWEEKKRKLNERLSKISG